MKRVLAVLVLLSSTAALAQQQPERPRQQPQQRVTEVPFDEGDLIEGATLRPDLADVTVRKAPEFESLIRPRTDFNDKVMDSVSQLP